jgi:hypothetical protein
MNPQRVPKILTYRTPGDLHNGGPVLFQLSIVATATPLSHQVRLVFIGGARRNVARQTALFRFNNDKQEAGELGWCRRKLEAA